VQNLFEQMGRIVEWRWKGTCDVQAEDRVQ
jgi:hypothetical protein